MQKSCIIEKILNKIHYYLDNGGILENAGNSSETQKGRLGVLFG